MTSVRPVGTRVSPIQVVGRQILSAAVERNWPNPAVGTEEGQMSLWCKVVGVVLDRKTNPMTEHREIGINFLFSGGSWREIELISLQALRQMMVGALELVVVHDQIRQQFVGGFGYATSTQDVFDNFVSEPPLPVAGEEYQEGRYRQSQLDIDREFKGGLREAQAFIREAPVGQLPRYFRIYDRRGLRNSDSPLVRIQQGPMVIGEDKPIIARYLHHYGDGAFFRAAQVDCGETRMQMEQGQIAWVQPGQSSEPIVDIAVHSVQITFQDNPGFWQGGLDEVGWMAKEPGSWQMVVSLRQFAGILNHLFDPQSPVTDVEPLGAVPGPTVAS